MGSPIRFPWSGKFFIAGRRTENPQGNRTAKDKTAACPEKIAAAAGGDPSLRKSATEGVQAASKNFKVHLDGCSRFGYLTGKTKDAARAGFVYFGDDGNPVACRDEYSRYVFPIQYATGTAVWRMPPTILRALPSDTQGYSIDGSACCEKWMMERAAMVLPAMQKAGQYLASYKDFPSRTHSHGAGLY